MKLLQTEYNHTTILFTGKFMPLEETTVFRLQIYNPNFLTAQYESTIFTVNNSMHACLLYVKIWKLNTWLTHKILTIPIMMWSITCMNAQHIAYTIVYITINIHSLTHDHSLTQIKSLTHSTYACSRMHVHVHTTHSHYLQLDEIEYSQFFSKQETK